MFGTKVLLKSFAWASCLCALILLWNEPAEGAGYITAKVIETLFIITAVVLTKDAAEIKIKQHE